MKLNSGDRIIVIQNRETDPKNALVDRVEACLSKHKLSVEVYSLSSRTEPVIKPKGATPALVVVVGGDGTFLNTVRAYGQDEVPLVGVNTGHLGFLTRIEPNKVEEYLEKIVSGEAVLQYRSMLAANNESQFALNDVVVKNQNPSRLTKINVYVADEHVATYDTDGIIVATATGSTAYNLSAGGPILDPEAESLAITPICPHSLSAKPIIVPMTKHVRLESTSANVSPLVCAIDGLEAFSINAGESIELFQSKYRLPLVSFAGGVDTFYSVLKRKLGWSANPRNIPTPTPS